METENALEIADSLVEFLASHLAARGGDTAALRPAHREVFHWPPYPVSKDFHVLRSEWTEEAELEATGETFRVDIARTVNGVFGRIDGIWNEARGRKVEEVVELLRAGAEPLFQRQLAIAEALGRKGRFSGRLRDLDANELLKLLYCRDRDVAHESSLEIETRASSGLFGPALLCILRDRTHPWRRVAQWCVLDMLEDLPSLCPTEGLQREAVDAAKGLLWDAEDDYGRTVYKAGVVLGGHMCTDDASLALLECLGAPSRIGRRSAIHAVFHLVEWRPDDRDRVLERLAIAAESDPEPSLRAFAGFIARDIASGAYEHVAEPLFVGELD